MSSTWLISAVAAVLLLLTSSPAPAQDRSREPIARELRTKFNDPDRQAARKWYEIRGTDFGMSIARDRKRNCKPEPLWTPLRVKESIPCRSTFFAGYLLLLVIIDMAF